jgi:farnesyl-diphosphate farnesyltransferase
MLAARSGRPAEARAAVPDLAADRAFCRAILPRVSRTFAINIRLLSGSFGEAVRTAYLLCRAADTLEDAWPADSATLARRFDKLLEALEGATRAADDLAGEAERAARPGLDSIAGLPRVLRVYASLHDHDRAVIADALRVMAHGMKKYATRAAERERGRRMVAYLDDTEELFDYCHVVAGCVGVMLTRMYNRRAPAAEPIETRRLELAPRVGEALQLTNIVLDLPSDLVRGRCHVPASWLDEVGLEPGQLVEAGTPGLRRLALRLDRLAREALARVPDYLDQVNARHLRYRLFCEWPALWASASLDRAWRDPAFPARGRPKLARHALWRIAAESLLLGRGAARRRLTRSDERAELAERVAV